jgi:hypothetical protein
MFPAAPPISIHRKKTSAVTPFLVNLPCSCAQVAYREVVTSRDIFQEFAA